MRDYSAATPFLAAMLAQERRERICVAAGVMDDPHADERARRAAQYAQRVDELLEVVGVARIPYDGSPASRQFERIARRATIFGD